ncbi:MAG: nitroreductase family protein [Vulcanimicrobiota bacterium]
MNNVIEAIFNRQSVRSYKDEQIKPGELELIVESGVQAATAKNRQPWHFTVIQNREFIDYMNLVNNRLMSRDDNETLSERARDGNFHVFYHAPTVIVVSGQKDNYYSLVDCSAAAQNMMVAAESLGIGTCWIGLIRYFLSLEEEVEKLKIPEGYEPFFAVCFGYKGENLNPKPVREKEVVSYIV